MGSATPCTYIFGWHTVIKPFIKITNILHYIVLITLILILKHRVAIRERLVWIITDGWKDERSDGLASLTRLLILIFNIQIKTNRLKNRYAECNIDCITCHGAAIVFALKLNLELWTGFIRREGMPGGEGDPNFNGSSNSS